MEIIALCHVSTFVLDLQNWNIIVNNKITTCTVGPSEPWCALDTMETMTMKEGGLGLGEQFILGSGYSDLPVSKVALSVDETVVENNVYDLCAEHEHCQRVWVQKQAGSDPADCISRSQRRSVSCVACHPNRAATSFTSSTMTLPPFLFILNLCLLWLLILGVCQGAHVGVSGQLHWVCSLSAFVRVMGIEFTY